MHDNKLRKRTFQAKHWAQTIAQTLQAHDRTTIDLLLEPTKRSTNARDVRLQP